MRRGLGELDMIINANIRQFRRERGLNQQSLGDVLGVSYQQIQKIECNKSRIAASQLYKIADRLNVPIACFFIGE